MEKILTYWNDSPARKSIVDFVEAVTLPDGPSYVPPQERIAVFDNDGTLWCEKPLYIQLDYILRRLTAQAEIDPSLRTRQPWQAAWEKDVHWLGSAVTRHYTGDDEQLMVLLDGILALAKDQIVSQVEAEAQEFVLNMEHPSLALPYRRCTYLPMLELLSYLEANGFTNYIVSAGGRDFMRGFAQELYDIPPERVIGSTVAYRFVKTRSGGEVRQRGKLDFICDGAGKAVQICNLIGRRPILAAGNSNGDLEMLMYTGGAGRSAMRLLLLHDDARREFAYTSGAEKALSAARAHGWNVVSMKNDFRQVFPD